MNKKQKIFLYVGVGLIAFSGVLLIAYKVKKDKE
jgi:hypothetical protein